MHVVKLGGSLLDRSSELRDWLRTVAAGGGRVVVVPGGGPFADAVRASQKRIGFDDRTAHRMALLAMEQYGWLLASMEPLLTPADSVVAIREALRGHRVPVWMPFRSVANREGIAASWEVTSDSLSAWLAREIGAATLWVVKACPVPDEDPAQIAVRGLVDAAFPGYCVGAPFQVRVLNCRESVRLATILSAEAVSPMDARVP